MALYSFHGQIIGRGKSIRMNQDGSVSEKAASRRSTSVAAAAYRAGTRLVDEHTGEVCDYTRKGGVVHTEIILHTNAPGRYHKPADALECRGTGGAPKQRAALPRTAESSRAGAGAAKLLGAVRPGRMIVFRPKLQRVSDLAHKRKQKAPAKTRRHDERKR